MELIHQNAMDWWQSLNGTQKFELLHSFPGLEEYASRMVISYFQKHSTEEVLFSLQHDEDGSRILSKYQKMTDDILDIASINHDDHFWHETREQIMVDAFMNSMAWFIRIYDSKIVPDVDDLIKLRKQQT